VSQLLHFTKWIESLTPRTLSDINKHYSKDVYFKDPFNEFTSIERITLVFSHMFENLEKPHFVFINTIESGEGAFLTWDFIFAIKGKEMKIHGGSLLRWDTEGKINYHRDYWDVGEELLLKIPVVKSFYRLIYNRFKLT